MKRVIAILSIMLTIMNGFYGPILIAGDSTFQDYQNYNHGYCPQCNSFPCVCNPASNSNPNDYEQEYTPVQPYPGASNETNPNVSSNPAPGNYVPNTQCNPTVCDQPCTAATDPCPTAPVCGAEVGISVAAISVGMIALGIAAAIIIISCRGNSASHS